MKILVFSDLHGDLESAHDLFCAIKYQKPDLIISLGDNFSYNHDNLADQLIVDFFNGLDAKLIMIKGNCDDDLNISKLKNKLLDYYELVLSGKRFVFTHGHLLSDLELHLKAQDTLVIGHTHYGEIKILDSGLIMANPGSISYPRLPSVKSYLIIENHSIKLYSSVNQLLDIKEY